MRKGVYYTFLVLLFLNCFFLLITLPSIFTSSENALSWLSDFLLTLFVGFPGTFRVINKYKNSKENPNTKTEDNEDRKTGDDSVHEIDPAKTEDGSPS